MYPRICTVCTAVWLASLSVGSFAETNGQETSLPGQCVACKALVATIEGPVKIGNWSVEHLSTFIQGICDHIPILKMQRQICDTVANKSAAIAKDILDGMPSEQICKQLELCSQGEPYESSAMSESSFAAKNTPQDSGCAVCKVVVTALTVRIKAGNWTIGALSKIAQGVCDHVPMFKVQKEICHLITSSIDTIAKDIAAGLDATRICKKMKYCIDLEVPREPANKDASLPGTCAACKILVSAMMQPVKIGNWSVQGLSTFVRDMCDHVPILRMQRQICDAVADKTASIATDILDGMPSEQICEKLGLCSGDEPPKSVSDSNVLIADTVGVTGGGCVVCKAVVSAVTVRVKAGNWTVGALSKIVKDMCDHIPMFKAQKELCYLISSSVDTIAKDIAAGMDAEQICEQMKLCTSFEAPAAAAASTAVIVVTSAEFPNSSAMECVECRMLVAAITAPVKAGNTTISGLAILVRDICDRIPILKLQREICDKVADSSELIAKYIAEGMDPERICDELRFCGETPAESVAIVI